MISTPEWVEAYLNTDDSQDFSANLYKRFVAEVCGVKLASKLSRNELPQRQEELAACLTYGVLTDESETLAKAIIAWLKWVGSRDVLSLDHYSTYDWFDLTDKIIEQLDTRGHASKDLARRLLEDGFAPTSLDSPSAHRYLLDAGFDVGFIREFLSPPPALVWDNIFRHPHGQLFPESPIAFVSGSSFVNEARAKTDDA